MARRLFRIGDIYYTDHLGIKRRVPTVAGLLKTRIPSHQALRLFVLHRDGRTCQWDGRTDHLEIAHVVPRASATTSIGHPG